MINSKPTPPSIGGMSRIGFIFDSNGIGAGAEYQSDRKMTEYFVADVLFFIRAYLPSHHEYACGGAVGSHRAELGG